MAAESCCVRYIYILCALLQMEQENQQLKMANLKQTEQIMLLQDKLQGEYDCRCYCTINCAAQTVYDRT